MIEEEIEEKKVEFIFDLEKLNEAAFLNKLTGAVKNISEKQAYIGLDKEGRQMKM